MGNDSPHISYANAQFGDHVLTPLFPIQVYKQAIIMNDQKPGAMQQLRACEETSHKALSNDRMLRIMRGL